jgi:hypothetical protein
MKTHRFLLSACCAWLALFVQSSAQLVRGVVVDAAGAPVRGAFVAILNEQGQQRTAVLTGAKGEYVFTAPPGRYSLKFELIGHQTSTVPLFTLETSDTRTDRVVLAVAALKLPELSVAGTNRCDRVDASVETARVWNEARKALTVAAWVGTRASATFRYRRTERELGLDLKDVRPARVTFSATAGQRVFTAANADSLTRFGYVQDRPSGRYMYGPDAELLLSNTFLTEHCFGLRRSNDRRGLIGLTFQPLRGRRLPDIAGVLWLDEQSAALRFIEYGFTGVEMWGDRRHAGGRTDFRQLPNGAWIVNSWYLRAPKLGRVAGPSGQLRVLSIHQEGGDVLDAQVTDGEQSALVKRVAVEGAVYDSIRGQPLQGARVYLSGTPFFAMADEQGRFRMDSVPAGEYAIAFEHPRVNTLPIAPEPVLFQVDSADVRNMQLATPSALRIMDVLCPAAERQRFMMASGDTLATNRGVIYGTVQPGQELLSDLEVGVTWKRFSMYGNRLSDARVRPHSLAVSIDPDGRYTICSVPIDHPMVIDLSLRRHLLQRDSLSVLPPGLVRRDFSVSERR